MIGAIIPALTPVLGKVVDHMFPNPADQERAKAELLKLQGSHEMQRVEQQLSAIIAEAHSQDPYTSRARPSFFYVMYTVILLCFIGGIVGVWYPAEMEQAGLNVKTLLGAIPEEMWWLFGTGYLGYTGARSYEKTKLAGKN